LHLTKSGELKGWKALNLCIFVVNTHCTYRVTMDAIADWGRFDVRGFETNNLNRICTN